MKIGKIILKGFQQFENFCLDLVNPETGKPPEKICFIGPNGTGKSTLLELIIRFLNKVNEPAFHPNQLANQPFFAVKIHTSAGDFLACSTFYGHPPFGNSIAYYNPDIEHTDEWHRFVADPQQYTMPVDFCLQYYIAGQPVPPLASDRDIVINLPADQSLML